MADFDFVIFTAGRAGSHLLASLLNSHPDIACEGEFGKSDTLINATKVSGSTRGCILAFGQRGLLFKWAPGKVIHMVRSPELGAESYLKNVIRHRVRKARRGGNPNPTLTEKRIAATTKRLRTIQYVSRNILRYYNHLEVSYEELTGNENISVMPSVVSDGVCDFLGVQRKELTTDLVKRGQSSTRTP